MGTQTVCAAAGGGSCLSKDQWGIGVQLEQPSGMIKNTFFKSVLTAAAFIQVGKKRGEWQTVHQSFVNLKNV